MYSNVDILNGDKKNFYDAYDFLARSIWICIFILLNVYIYLTVFIFL